MQRAELPSAREFELARPVACAVADARLDSRIRRLHDVQIALSLCERQGDDHLSTGRHGVCDVPWEQICREAPVKRRFREIGNKVEATRNQLGYVINYVSGKMSISEIF